MTTGAQDYKALTQRIYDLFAKGDIPGVIQMCAPAVEWTSYGPQGMEFVGTFNGRNGVKRYFDLNGAAYTVAGFNPGPMYGEAQTVVVTGWEEGTMPNGGQAFRNDWAHVWTYDGTEVARFTEYLTSVVQ